MNLIRTSLLSFVSTSVKMLAGLIISKTVALVAGPSGLATVGQFQNFVQIALTAGKGSLDTGITKYTAEFHNDPARSARLFSTAAYLCTATCLAVSVILLVFARPLSELFLYSFKYAYIIRLFGLTICLFVLNSVVLAVVNGLGEIRTFIAVNIAQSVLTLALTIGLIFWLDLDGALIALATNQSLVLGVLLWALRRHAIIRWANFRAGFDRDDAIRLLKYGMMTAVSAFAAPLTAILVRDQVVTVLGQQEAGYWQAIWYVANVYMTVVTTSLAVYYLPKLSATIDPVALRGELKQAFVIVMPIAACAALTVYLTRGWVVRILFSDAFLPMLPLFGWMMVGDVIKIASWLLSYLMLAKAMTRAFVTTELVFSASFFALAAWFIRVYGLPGVVYAYALNYLAYLVAVAALTRRFWLSDR